MSSNSSKSSNSSNSPSPPIPPNLAYVAKGSYGCVIKPALPNRADNSEPWMQYPTHVTKLFFDKKYMYKANTNSKRVYNLLGHNKGHKTHKYKHKYRSSNIPNNIRTRCAKIGKNVPLYPLMMPNLGNDFWGLGKDMKYKKYRSISVTIILEQILKIMKEIQILVNNNLIHGDIRETNLLIHPETGTMTIIDFDLLYPSNVYYDKVHLGFYCNPPEVLLYTKFKKFMNAPPADLNVLLDRHEIDSQLDKYEKRHTAFRFAQPQYLDRKASKSDIKSALKDSIFYFASHLDSEDSGLSLQKELRAALLPSYDGYGFAFTMLEFLGFVYPTTTIRVRQSRLDASLATRISNEGEPYTDTQIATISQTIHRLVFEVLEPMVDLRIRRRMGIHDAVERVQSIIKEFRVDMNFN
jgi:hypothetical protein